MLDDPFFRTYPSRQARPVPVRQHHRYSSPKVSPVPVHFVSSKESAALKIQRVFRGFVVRRSVKNISSIRNEVFKLEMSIHDAEIVDLIRIDAKERLRVNETLMSLLLKLDSIRGVDSGVRDFRKAVINKAISLQEIVDSIVSSNNRSAEIGSEIASSRDQIVDDSIYVIADGVIDSKTEVANEIVVNCNSIDKKKSIEILEKLMDDNEKMMTIMTRIFERNEMQTRMLNSLSQRVEQLEQVFICDKPRKKRKKNMHFV